MIFNYDVEILYEMNFKPFDCLIGRRLYENPGKLGLDGTHQVVCLGLLLCPCGQLGPSDRK